MPRSSAPSSGTGSSQSQGAQGQNTTPATLSDYSGTYYIRMMNGYVWQDWVDDDWFGRYAFNNSREQQFRFEKQANGKYKIISVATNKLLTFALSYFIPDPFVLMLHPDIEKNPPRFPMQNGYNNDAPVYAMEQLWDINAFPNAAGSNVVVIRSPFGEGTPPPAAALELRVMVV